MTTTILTCQGSLAEEAKEGEEEGRGAEGDGSEGGVKENSTSRSKGLFESRMKERLFHHRAVIRIRGGGDRVGGGGGGGGGGEREKDAGTGGGGGNGWKKGSLFSLC